MATRKTASQPAASQKAPTRAKAPAAATKGKNAKPAPQVAAAAAKPAKPQQHKLVRDSFTIPKNEYAVLADLKQRAAKLARPAKKSEILRAGISALNAMADSSFLSALGKVPPLKTGRPKDEAASAGKAAAKKP